MADIPELNERKNEAIKDIFHENLDELLEYLRNATKDPGIGELQFNDFVTVVADKDDVVVRYSYDNDTVLSLNSFRMQLSSLIKVLEKFEAFQAARGDVSDGRRSTTLNVEIEVVDNPT